MDMAECAKYWMGTMYSSGSVVGWRLLVFLAPLKGMRWCVNTLTRVTHWLHRGQAMRGKKQLVKLSALCQLVCACLCWERVWVNVNVCACTAEFVWIYTYIAQWNIFCLKFCFGAWRSTEGFRVDPKDLDVVLALETKKSQTLVISNCSSASWVVPMHKTLLLKLQKYCCGGRLID